MLDARIVKLPANAQQHHHEHHQVVVGVRGAAELSVDGLGAYLDTWKACLVPTEIEHDFCGDQQNHVLVINLDPHSAAFGSSAHREYELLARLFDKPCTVQMDHRLQGLVQYAAGEFDRAPNNDPLHRHLGASILYSMADRVIDGASVKPARHSVSPEATRRFILDNLHRKITVKDLAGEACLSVSRFHEIFREVAGITPHQFLLRTRLEQAASLLACSQLSVSEISYRTGFSSQSALTNALRKYKGTTPSRLQIRENVA